jgi:hypothetical protein
MSEIRTAREFRPKEAEVISSLKYSKDRNSMMYTGHLILLGWAGQTAGSEGQGKGTENCDDTF